MIVNSNDFFSLDGVSCETVGLYCDTPPVQPLADTNGTNYEIGDDEDIYVDDDSFKDITFRFTCYEFFPDDFNTSAIYDFLHGKKHLSFSRNGEYFYKIRSVSCSASNTYDGSKVRYQITFKCAPFRYIANEEPVQIDGSGYVTNIGTRYSKPVYTLSVSSTGTGSLSVNGELFSISIPSGTNIKGNKIIIDAENDLVYTEDGKNLMPYTTGEIQFLSVGVNYIVCSGLVKSASVQINGRCY